MTGLLYLSRDDVERLGLGMDEVVAAVERSFLLKGRGETQLPPKLGVAAGEALSRTPCRPPSPARELSASSGCLRFPAIRRRGCRRSPA